MSTYLNPGECYGMDDLKRANHRAGLHFFDPDSMRFFRSRVSDIVYTGKAAWYFVTSEQFTMPGYAAKRLYTVRKMNPDGSIDTVGDFNKVSRSTAHRQAAKLASES